MPATADEIDVSSIEERLARIEESQRHHQNELRRHNERLEKLVHLMEEVVRIEVQHTQHGESIKRLGERMETVETRIEDLSRQMLRSSWIVSRVERLLWLGATAAAGSMSWWLERLGG